MSVYFEIVQKQLVIKDTITPPHYLFESYANKTTIKRILANTIEKYAKAK